MLIKEEKIRQIIEEEARNCINEFMLLEQARWAIPGDKTYEYHLTPDGKGYVAYYKDGKKIGTFRGDEGLKKVKDAQPSALAGLTKSASEWWSKESPPPDWTNTREANPKGPVHQLQSLLGVSADGVFGKNSKAAWSRQSGGAALPSTPDEALRVVAKRKEERKDCIPVPSSWNEVYPSLLKVGRISDGDKVIIVDGRTQTLKVVQGQNVASYPCSTSRKGFSNSSFGGTSTGLMQVHSKVGSGQPYGRIFVGKQTTKYVLKDNQGKHAWVCTRLLVLAGQQPENGNVYSRNIYIHGTNRLSSLGRPASGGCIRVSNDTILKLFDEIANGTLVYVLGTPTSTNPEFPCEGRGLASTVYDLASRGASGAAGLARRLAGYGADTQVSGEPVHESGEDKEGEDILGEPALAPDPTA
jgi:hypothetical protein